jgi:hypothetical protein
MSDAAGWYPDPWQVHEYRYHDGRAWTANVANHGRASLDPQPHTMAADAAVHRRGRRPWPVLALLAAGAALLLVVVLLLVGSTGGNTRTTPASRTAITAWVTHTRGNLFADEQILIDITRDHDAGVCQTDLQSFRDRFSDFFPTPWTDVTATLRSFVADGSRALHACAAGHQSSSANDAAANDLATVRTQIRAHGFNADGP